MIPELELDTGLCEFDDIAECKTVTLYFTAPKELVSARYPEAEAAEISVTFSSDDPDPQSVTSELSPTKGGEDYAWSEVYLPPQTVQALMDKAGWTRRPEEGNAPLTMDQLLQMNGQPVYVVGEPGGCIDGWQLVMIGRFDVDMVFFTSYTGYRVTLNEADKDIRAIYRRPPEEGRK